MRKQYYLFTIIFLEGYVALATELLAIRQLIPFVGSGIEVVSIIIGAVLLPLAIGYHVGGRRAKADLKRARRAGAYSISIRRILQKNLFIALLILTLGLSYTFLRIVYFNSIGKLMLGRVTDTAIYAMLFLVVPLYMLGQTVPLTSNYFRRSTLAETTGRILFYSTAGSFLGSLFSTLILMTFIGVRNTVIITLFLLALLIALVSSRRQHGMLGWTGAVLFVMLTMNSSAFYDDLHIIADTPYSLVRLFEDGGDKILDINHSPSSKYSAEPERRFEYLRYIESNFINTMYGRQEPKILILGAGGFTIGWDDKTSEYTFVDIEPALKAISEKDFLPNALPPNKRFIATSARAFLARTQEKYDLVIVDVYSNILSIPAEAVTRDFWLDVKNVLKPDGILVANAITSQTFNDRFSLRYYNTFASVFPVFSRQIIGNYNPWDKRTLLSNILYVYYNKERIGKDNAVYTDDKNSYNFDH